MAADTPGSGVVAVISARIVVAVVVGLGVADLTDTVVVRRVARARIVAEVAPLRVGAANAVIDAKVDIPRATVWCFEGFPSQINVACLVGGVTDQAVNRPIAIFCACALARVSFQIVAVDAGLRAMGPAQQQTVPGRFGSRVRDHERSHEYTHVSQGILYLDPYRVRSIDQQCGVDVELVDRTVVSTSVICVDVRNGRDRCTIEPPPHRIGCRQTVLVGNLDFESIG